MSGEWDGRPAPWSGPPPPPAPVASTPGTRRRVRPEPVGRPPHLRAVYASLALGAMLGIGVLGGVLGPVISTEVREWDERADADRVAAACRVERDVIRTAEALYRRDHPEFGGTYTDMAGLVAGGYLTRASTRFDVVLADPPVSFSLRPLGECR